MVGGQIDVQWMDGWKNGRGVDGRGGKGGGGVGMEG